jgi:hypothetical protein
MILQSLRPRCSYYLGLCSGRCFCCDIHIILQCRPDVKPRLTGNQRVTGRSRLDCLTNCINLRSVRRSGDQQGTVSAAKKSASSAWGLSILVRVGSQIVHAVVKKAHDPLASAFEV